MSASQSDGMTWDCEGCGAHLPVKTEHLGRKCRCQGCGLMFVVTAKRMEQMAEVSHEEESSEPPQPETEVFDQTASYGLWGVDEAPLPTELAHRQPKWFPLYCHNCDTLMHATVTQVGTNIVCHDCGAKTIFKAPPPEPADSSVPPVDGYDLDETSVPSPRPSAVPAIVRREELERQQAMEQEGAAREKTDQQRPIASGSRPKMPRVPLIQGVLPMLWTEMILARWVTLSFGFIFVGSIGFGAWILIQSGIGALIGIWFIAAFSALSLLWMMAASAFWISILTESSEGNQQIHNPPGIDFTAGMGDLLYVVIASMVAAIPTTAIVTLVAGQSSWIVGTVAMVCWLQFFPVTILSSLEIGSPLGVFSPRLAKAFIRRCGAWLLLTILACLLVVTAAAIAGAMVNYSPWLALAAGPVLVGTSFIYFRLLGRFAWWLTAAG